MARLTLRAADLRAQVSLDALSVRDHLRIVEQEIDGVEVALRAATDDLVPCRWGDDRDAPPRLACGDVGEMDLDDGAAAPEERVVERVAGVRQSAGVDH